MFARRASWDLSENELARRAAERRARGLEILDLSDANPTHHGLREPQEALREALRELARDPAAARYEPEPRGDAGARAAVAAYHRRGGASPEAEHVVLTSGTSEAYAHLFRLLADPGEVVHLPEPGYPLFEHLAALEGLAVRRYRLEPPAGSACWRLDLDGLERTLDRASRLVLVIHPHNPSGSYAAASDLARLRGLCRERGLALVSDEVFADYAWEGDPPPGALAGGEAGPLCFALSGASKVLGLPQLKLAWIAASGPPAARDEALARLEFVADAYLSVSPLLARTLPGLLARRAEVQAEIRARIAENRAALAASLAPPARAALLPAEAGWSALVALRGGIDEEALASDLLERAGVRVEPGFLFDLEPAGETSGHLVLGLLADPARFARGVAALRDALDSGAEPRAGVLGSARP